MTAVETADPAEPKAEIRTFGRERFAPGAYHLDLAGVATVALLDNGQPSTFIDICRKLWNATGLKVSESHASYEEVFETEAGQVTVTGESGQLFVLRVLRDLVELRREGIDPYRATWFYYEHDWSRDALLLL